MEANSGNNWHEANSILKKQETIDFQIDMKQNRFSNWHEAESIFIPVGDRSKYRQQCSGSQQISLSQVATPTSNFNFAGSNTDFKFTGCNTNFNFTGSIDLSRWRRKEINSKQEGVSNSRKEIKLTSKKLCQRKSRGRSRRSPEAEIAILGFPSKRSSSKDLTITGSWDLRSPEAERRGGGSERLRDLRIWEMRRREGRSNKFFFGIFLKLGVSKDTPGNVMSPPLLTKALMWPEINEDPQNISQEAGQNVSCLFHTSCVFFYLHVLESGWNFSRSRASFFYHTLPSFFWFSYIILKQFFLSFSNHLSL